MAGDLLSEAAGSHTPLKAKCLLNESRLNSKEKFQSQRLFSMFGVFEKGQNAVLKKMLQPVFYFL